MLQLEILENPARRGTLFDVRVTRNRSKDDNHAKPVPRKIAAHRSPSAHTAWATQRGASRKSHLERGRSKVKEIHTRKSHEIIPLSNHIWRCTVYFF